MRRAHFLIDDVIWVLRDVARNQPASLFDNPFLAVLKHAHESYGIKVQLNLFFRTSSFYGNDEFTLFDMPDVYKKEWELCSDWLKFGFHAKEEFPDYPHVNATYEDIKSLFETIRGEVVRFAGEKSFAYGVCPHWNPVSKAGVKALYDCGVRVLDVSVGNAIEYDGNPDSLPYGHAMRLLNNRQKETRVFQRGGPNTAINNSICSYNHFTPEQLEQTRDNLSCIRDDETGMLFKKFHIPAMTLNLMPCDKVEKTISQFLGSEYIGICTHEQYFYEDYMSYQPDYAEKIYRMGKLLFDNGYEFFFPEELALK